MSRKRKEGLLFSLRDLKCNFLAVCVHVQDKQWWRTSVSFNRWYFYMQTCGLLRRQQGEFTTFISMRTLSHPCLQRQKASAPIHCATGCLTSVLLSPSLGLSSIRRFFQWLVPPSGLFLFLSLHFTIFFNNSAELFRLFICTLYFQLLLRTGWY